ncbi:hypothetical protein DPMN_164498, partial [Dreissena polymorpha]
IAYGNTAHSGHENKKSGHRNRKSRHEHRKVALRKGCILSCIESQSDQEKRKHRMVALRNRKKGCIMSQSGHSGPDIMSLE